MKVPHSYIASCLIAYAANTYAEQNKTIAIGEGAPQNVAITLPDLPAEGRNSQPSTAYVDSSKPNFSSADYQVQQAKAMRAQPKSVSLEEMKNKTVPIALGKETTAFMGAKKFELQHQSESFYGNFGMGGVAQKKDGLSPAATFNTAYLLTEQAAVGGNLFLSSQRSEIVLNALYLWPFGLRTKGSFGYMWGKQEFDFPSGKKSVNLSQTAYAFDAKYHGKNWLENLQAVGLGIWGASAKQHSENSAIYFLNQTSESATVFLDSRKLALGRLSGQAVDMQLALFPDVVMQTAIGREHLVFPFSDGTQERHAKLFTDLKLHYEPTSNWLLSAYYQNGASGQQISFSTSYLDWKLTLMQQRGSHGVKSSHNVMLSYDFVSAKRNSRNETLAQRMQVTAQDNRSSLLREAATRPEKMPRDFLAKLDPTALKTVFKVCKNSDLKDISISKDGLLGITVGSGAITITQILRNNQSFAHDGIFSGGNARLNIHLPYLPRALASDLYVIEILDGSGTRYQIDADASLVKNISC